MESRTPTTPFFAWILPLLALPIVAVGFMMTNAGHGNYLVIACITFPLGMGVAALLMAMGNAPVELFLIFVTLATVMQYAALGYFLDRLRARNKRRRTDDRKKNDGDSDWTIQPDENKKGRITDPPSKVSSKGSSN